MKNRLSFSFITDMKKVSRIILLSLIFCFSIFTKAETKQQLKDHQSTVKVLTVDKLHVFFR